MFYITSSAVSFPYQNSYGLNINSDVFIVFDTWEIISLNIFYEFLPI